MKYLFRKTENIGIEINDAYFVTVMESTNDKMVTTQKTRRPFSNNASSLGRLFACVFAPKQNNFAVLSKNA